MEINSKIGILNKYLKIRVTDTDVAIQMFILLFKKLACGHSACYVCIKNFQNTTALTHVKCQSCNKLNILDAEYSESVIAQRFKEAHNDKLIDLLKIELENEMENYKCKLNDTFEVNI